MLSESQDIALRAYAKRLHPILGEDAYHNSVCDAMRRVGFENIRSIEGFFRRAIKMSLFKIFRHEKVERNNMQSFINGDPVPMTVGLVYGRMKHDVCRKKLHSLIEGNLVYVGGRRTCQACKRMREAIDARRRYKERKHEMDICDSRDTVIFTD